MQLRTHPVLLGECLGGALYIQDFIRLARQVSVFAWHSFLLACRLLVHLLRLYTTKYSENPHLLFRLFQVSASLNHVAQAGFTDPRILEQSELVVNDPELREVLGEARFFSMTYRYESVPAQCPSITFISPFTGTGWMKIRVGPNRTYRISVFQYAGTVYENIPPHLFPFDRAWVLANRIYPAYRSYMQAAHQTCVILAEGAN